MKPRFDRDAYSKLLDTQVKAVQLGLIDVNDEKAIAQARKAAGTASVLYRPGHKIWNWFWDTEYTNMWPPYFFMLFGMLIGGFCLCVGLLK